MDKRSFFLRSGSWRLNSPFRHAFIWKQCRSRQGRAGLFHKCCTATCKLTTTWQNDWQLCTINTAICSSNCPCTKNKCGVYSLKKPTNKKPHLCNCLLIMKGRKRILVSAFRQRPELHINPAHNYTF